MNDEPITQLDDTEGHRFRGIVEQAEEIDDAEGHTANAHRIAAAGEADDTEGHKFHGTVSPAGDDDDADGRGSHNPG